MIGRTNILAMIRRRRDSLGRLVLVFFAVASVTIGAVPCVAMGAATKGDPASHHGASHSGSALGSHDHSHPATHGGATQPDESPHSPNHCPHCPLSTSMPGHNADNAHSFCAAVDDTSDRAQPSPPPLLHKHVPLAPLLELAPPPSVLPPPGIAASRMLVPAFSPVALNLRHCVFLI
jgi:hypothetical protein